MLGLLAQYLLDKMGYSSGTNKRTENYFKDYIRKQYPGLSDEQVNALYAQYERTPGGLGINFNDPRTYIKYGGAMLGNISPVLGAIGQPVGNFISDIGTKLGLWHEYGYDTFDKDDLDAELAKLQAAYDELGYAPEMLSSDQLKEIEEGAYADIDAENRQIFDLYDRTLNRTTDALQQNLMENNAAFSDYRNQLLTNDVMNQQAIAGATRFELDRQQRNAITRGASAAQRLVANINTQLGMQAQSAQQALQTSNALAQQLLAHRQAQAGIRQDYTNALNQYDMNRANQLSGQAERRMNYAQGKMDFNLQKNQYARDAWNERVNNYFQGDSTGAGIYRQQYGSGKNKSNSL